MAMSPRPAGQANPLEDNLEIESLVQPQLHMTADNAEGVAAFREKRAAGVSRPGWIWKLSARRWRRKPLRTRLCRKRVFSTWRDYI